VLLITILDPLPQFLGIPSNSSEGVDDTALAEVEVGVEVVVQVLVGCLHVRIVDLYLVLVDDLHLVLAAQNREDVLGA